MALLAAAQEEELETGWRRVVWTMEEGLVEAGKEKLEEEAEEAVRSIWESRASARGPRLSVWGIGLRC